MNRRKISLRYLCLLLYNLLNRRQPRKRRMGSWSQCTNERLWRLPMNAKVGRGVPTAPSGVVKRSVLTVRRGGVRTRQPYPPVGESCFARTRRQDAGAPRPLDFFFVRPERRRLKFLPCPRLMDNFSTPPSSTCKT